MVVRRVKVMWGLSGLLPNEMLREKSSSRMESARSRRLRFGVIPSHKVALWNFPNFPKPSVLSEIGAKPVQETSMASTIEVIFACITSFTKALVVVFSIYYRNIVM